MTTGLIILAIVLIFTFALLLAGMFKKTKISEEDEIGYIGYLGDKKKTFDDYYENSGF